MSINARMESQGRPARVARHSPLPDIIGLGGTMAGLGAGLAMALTGLLFALALGQDIWSTPKQIAAAFGVGSGIIQPGFEILPVLTGSLIHLGTSMLLGAAFGIVTRRIMHLPSGFGVPLVSGLVYGLLIWLVAYAVFVPLMNPTLALLFSPAFIIQNFVYGVVLGLLYGYLRP